MGSRGGVGWGVSKAEEVIRWKPPALNFEWTTLAAGRRINLGREGKEHHETKAIF